MGSSTGWTWATREAATNKWDWAMEQAAQFGFTPLPVYGWGLMALSGRADEIRPAIPQLSLLRQGADALGMQTQEWVPDNIITRILGIGPDQWDAYTGTPASWQRWPRPGNCRRAWRNGHKIT